jgi:hypothetical protein
MSKILKYVGKSATVRIIRPEDFEQLGVEHDEVRFDIVDIPTRGQAEVSDAAAEALLGVEPGNFREVSDEERAPEFKRSESDASGTGKKGTTKE